MPSVDYMIGDYFVPHIFNAARTTFDSFDPEDIDDGEGNLAVIVDVVVNEFNSNDNDYMLGVISLMGGPAYEHDPNCEELDYCVCEFVAEAMEEAADKIADQLNEAKPDTLEGSFFFTWNEGMFVLMYSEDKE